MSRSKFKETAQLQEFPPPKNESSPLKVRSVNRRVKVSFPFPILVCGKGSLFPQVALDRWDKLDSELGFLDGCDVGVVFVGFLEHYREVGKSVFTYSEIVDFGKPEYRGGLTIEKVPAFLRCLKGAGLLKYRHLPGP